MTMNEKPRVIRTVEGIDPVEFGKRALVMYHLAVEQGFSTDPSRLFEISYRDQQRQSVGDHLTHQQRQLALAAADQSIRHSFPEDDQINPDKGGELWQKLLELI
jgi:hypothetical protein